jgi:ABC-2 type transport system ATP-binding protein
MINSHKKSRSNQKVGRNSCDLFKNSYRERGSIVTTPTPQNPPAIEVSNLSKRYPKAGANALDDVSFTVRPGEIFGLLGPNGAGKTTIVGILTTSVVPTSGDARIMGIDVARDPIGIKQRISVVPQKSNLDLSLKAREILTFHASYHGVPAAERNALADKLLVEFGLMKQSKEKVLHYSGGMTQRVMIARALMHTPDVLFLDEPTNNLDPQARLFLWERIHTLQERGITILLTTHDMEEASHLCDRIAIMDHGRILVCDTPAELEKLIPGGTKLELRISVPKYALAAAQQSNVSTESLATSQIQQALSSLDGVTRVEEIHSAGDVESQTNISVLHLYAEDASALIARAVNVISECNAELRDLHVAHPSMEDVFIYLTGRDLRS